MSDVNPALQPVQAGRAEPRDTTPLTLPTRETLVKCHKSDLQKRCRELGLNKIWVRKDQLIDMILQASKTDSLVALKQHLATPSPSPTPAAPPPHCDAAHLPDTTTLHQGGGPQSLLRDVTQPITQPASLDSTKAHATAQPASLDSAQPSPHAAPRPANLGSAEPSPHAVAQPAGLGSTEPSPHVAQPASLGSAEPSPHVVAQPASLGSAEPSPDAAAQPASLGSAELPPHVAPQPASLDNAQLPRHAATQPASLSFLPEAVQTPSIAVARRHSLPLDIPHILSRTTQTSFNKSSEPSSPACNSNNTCECKSEIKKIKQDVATIVNKLKTKDNEIELLNEEVKTAYTVIELLQQRISELEKEDQRGNNQQEKAPSPQIPSKCLLLGDTNLKRIVKSDLKENCSVRTIPYANMDLLRSWVREKLSWIPSDCVVYCGLHDINDGLSSDAILDNLGSLISDLKDKNSAMNINICQIALVPMLTEINNKIAEYNDNLKNWGEKNGVSIIKIPPVFILGTGEVDDICFDNDDDLPTLNRLGIVKLLSTIEKQCPSFKLSRNWMKIKKDVIATTEDTTKKRDQSMLGEKRNYDPTNAHSSNSSRPGSNSLHSPSVYLPPPASQASFNHITSVTPPRSPPTRPVHQTPQSSTHEEAHEASLRSQRSHTRWRPTTRHHSVRFREDTERYPEPPAPRAPQHSMQRGPGMRWGYDMGYQDPRDTMLPEPTEVMRGGHRTDARHTGAQTLPPQHSHYRTPRSSYPYGCYNCGEHNHQQRRCRYDHRLRCATCHELGHKQRLCKYYRQ